MIRITSKWDVEDVITEISSSQINSFYPTYISKITGISLDHVFEYLKELSDDGKIQILWEIRCPNYGCFRTIRVAEGLDDLLGETIDCSGVCGEEITVTPDIVFPVIHITPEYRERVKKNETRTHSELLVPLVARNYNSVR